MRITCEGYFFRMINENTQSRKKNELFIRTNPCTPLVE